MIPYGKQSISEDDVQAVIEVLRSDYLTQGPAVPQFESAISQYCLAENAIAVSNATSALHIACLALDLKKGDYLWTSPITFVASANCAFYCGASVDFVDINPETYNLCAVALEEKLQRAKKVGKLPKIVVPVHFGGEPCDMARIYELACEYGFKVIEDASHAIGGKYKNQPIGSCHYSDITVFSFHPVKVITTAEGGLATTNNKELAHRMRLLRSHGITRDQEHMVSAKDGPWFYEQVLLGFNYRLNDIQAALGLSQLKRLDSFVNARHMIANRYADLLLDLPVKIQKISSDSYSSYHLYVIRLELDKINHSHKQVFEQLKAKGVGVNIHYIPVYKQPYYQYLNQNYQACESAEQYYREAISLPIYPNLTESKQEKVFSALRAILL